MELYEQKRVFSEALEKTADAIDLTEAQYKAAIEKYEAVTKFLSSESSLLRKYNPILFSQGSFRLGTAVRPVVEEDEFDVDVTLRLEIKLPDSQKRIKTEVEKQFRTDNSYKNMLKEKQRCWRLEYSDSSRFHMDVVPAVPENYQRLVELNIPLRYAEHAIKITDKWHKNYVINSADWPRSNTEGFALWFLDVMKEQADRIRMDLRKSLLLENVQDVPFYKVRTPLQRTIQILKRHRDLIFRGDEDKPASIIITTLAAKAYKELLVTNSMPIDFYDVLMKLLELMPSLIESRNGIKWIENPVDTSENFADRWTKKPVREKMFNQWVDKAKETFTQAFRKGDIQTALDYLKTKLGDRTISEATKAMSGSGAVFLVESSRMPSRFDVPHRDKPLWPIKRMYSVTITGRYKAAGNWNWVDLNHDILPKGADLIFHANTDVPEPFNVFWQVVNTGAEAAALGPRGLRGNIFPAQTLGKGGLQQKESTSYTGNHWIECFIAKDNVCVARSGEYLVNIE